MASVSDSLHPHTQKIVVLVSGPTCSGKSSTIDVVLENPNVGAVGCFIGREMRKRHPPEYFQGKMASPHTEDEVREIFSSVYEDFLKSDKRFLLCDGLPRLRQQCTFLRDKIGQNATVVVVAFSPSDVTRRERMAQRGGSVGDVQLASDRFHLDAVMLRDVYDEIDTSCPSWIKYQLSGEQSLGLVVFEFECILEAVRVEQETRSHLP